MERRENRSRFVRRKFFGFALSAMLFALWSSTEAQQTEVKVSAFASSGRNIIVQ